MSLLLIRSHGRDIAVAAEGLIKRAEFDRLADADRVLYAARADAAAVLAEAHEEAALIREQAYAEGLRSGHEAAIVAVLGTLEVEQRMIDLLADRIGGVVEQCIRSLVGQVGMADLFRARIQHAVSSLAPGGGATLHVAPGQAHIAKEALAELAASAGVDLRWIVVQVDERCPPQEFMIETAVGFIDARLSATLSDARRIIAQAIRRAGERLPLPARDST